jgi:thiamine-phosphate pyrophosphorylase
LDIRERLNDSRLYFVTGPAFNGRSVADTVALALKGGVDIVQLRDKTLNDAELLALARVLRRLTRDAGALFIVNDRVDVALLSDADGVHVGQDDLPPMDVRRLIGPGRLVGVSTHAPDQARKALEDGADYLGVGPVYPTPTKAHRPAVGLEYVVQVAALSVPVPWFAIGGVTGANLVEVIAAGARRIAVVRALAESENPEKTARELKKGIGGIS